MRIILRRCDAFSQVRGSPLIPNLIIQLISTIYREVTIIIMPAFTDNFAKARNEEMMEE